ncbi:MAG: hypothetical protein J6K13_05010 [Clostridia bacterium]|nr:hypothetical protein [Clostridia bacterium]
MIFLDILQSVKIVIYLLGQLSVSGQDDVRRLNACFDRLNALKLHLEAPPAEEPPKE